MAKHFFVEACESKRYPVEEQRDPLFQPQIVVNVFGHKFVTKMRLFISFIVSLALVHGLKDLPERARGGEGYKMYLKQNGLTAKAGEGALSWQAKVDNFDVKNNATYSQRYYVNDKYWNKGVGPVFYEIGGEGTLNGPPGGYIEQLAAKQGALLIALEHRFYGESIPNGNIKTENYRFLTVEQALADLSAFTDFYKSTVSESKAVPWFVFGGSYPGALSSWYRQAYPDQSAGSLSSSGEYFSWSIKFLHRF